MIHSRGLPVFVLCIAGAFYGCSASNGGGGAADEIGGTSAAPVSAGDAGKSASGGSAGLGCSASLGGSSAACGGNFGAAGTLGGANTAGGSAGLAGSSTAGGGSTVGGSSGLGGDAGGPGSSAGSPNGGGRATGSSEPSGMPIPSKSGAPKPSGTPGDLTILDWAGFKAAVSFTFDDALSSQISNYAALQGTGVPLTFYLVSNNNGTSATWAQAAKDGHELGNHTAHHCHDNGTGCAWGTYAGSLGAEYDQCTTHIEQQFGTANVWTTASPYGDAGYAAPASTRFLLNRGVQGGSVGPNDDTSPFALPCHTAAPSETASTFNAATDAARSAGKWQIFLIHSLGGDGGYNPISITDAVGAIDHAKTAGDTWADSMVHVGAYWRAQKLVSGVTPATSGNGKTWSWTLPEHFPSGRYLRVTVAGGTLSQAGKALAWSGHGYYEVALDAGSVTLSP